MAGMNKFDVVIVGGGISGFAAAVAAARQGVTVMIIEQYGFLGGMLTAAGVGPMMSFHAGDVQVVKGVVDELIERLKSMGKSPGHVIDSTGHTATVTPFDAEAMKYVMEQMVLESGAKIMYHASLLNTYVEDGILKSVELYTKNGIISVSGKIFVDATGDGDLAKMSGVPFRLGDAEDNFCQPMTMNMKMGNVNIDKIRSYMKENTAEFPGIEDKLHIVDDAQRLSVDGFVTIRNNATASGELDFGREKILFFETNNPNEVIVNTTRVSMENPTDPWQLSEAETEGRRQCHELEKFLVQNVPGFENAVMLYSGPVQIGIRSSRQIEGLYTLTAEDLISETVFEDSVAFGGYPIDIHPPKGGFSGKMLEIMNSHCEKEKGFIYCIPYRSLLNKYVTNIITVGRCISCTFEAQGAIRVSPIAGSIGQAGGTAAALALKYNNNPPEVDTAVLQDEIEKHNGYMKRNRT